MKKKERKVAGFFGDLLALLISLLLFPLLLAMNKKYQKSADANQLK